MTTLEDSFIEATIAELIKIPNDDTLIAPIKTHTMKSSTISKTGRLAVLIKIIE